MAHIPIGKLPADLLGDVLQKYVRADERVVVGPRIGQDAAVIDMGERYLVVTTDPITFATDQIGWYAVQVNANDVACCGAVPRWFLAVLLLPEKSTTPELAETIFAQISGACGELGISLCGGHTEITPGLDRPIVVGQMLGEVPRGKYLTSSDAQIGDVLILTKGFAIEGTAIIAKEQRENLRSAFSEDELERCANFLYSPGISVVKDARHALEAGGVHALHDATEGGVATALWELAEAAGVGLVIDEQRLLILSECDRLCSHFGLNPLGLISSGALLIAAEQPLGASIIERLNAAGIRASAIGQIVPPQQGCKLRSTDGKLRSLPVFARDEITRLFD